MVKSRHNVIDEWFVKVVKPHCEGEAIICRYADDFVCAFQFKSDAERFYKVLPKRLEKYNLEVAEDKTQCMRFSRFEPSLMNRFTFLGFEFYWDWDKKKTARLFRRTARKKLQVKKAELSAYIKKNRYMKTSKLIGKLTEKLRGHYGYFGVVGNLDSLKAMYSHAEEKLYKWLNRRSGRKSMTWKKLKRTIAYCALARPVVKARTTMMRVWW